MYVCLFVVRVRSSFYISFMSARKGGPNPSLRPSFRYLSRVLYVQVDKNVVMLEKRKDGTIAKHVQATPEDCIKLGAMLPPVDLTSAYGVSASLAATMDSAAKAAVAAGLEVS